MKKIEFESTFGDHLTNPKSEVIKDLIFNHTLEEWEGGSGDSMMHYENDSNSASLSISAHKDYGFLILYSNLNERNVVTEGNHSGEIVTFADNYTQSFREQLVSREIAWQAIEYFMETGKQLDSLNWKKYITPEVE